MCVPCSYSKCPSVCTIINNEGALKKMICNYSPQKTNKHLPGEVSFYLFIYTLSTPPPPNKVAPVAMARAQHLVVMPGRGHAPK